MVKVLLNGSWTASSRSHEVELLYQSCQMMALEDGSS